MKKLFLCCTLLMLLTGAWVRAQDSYNDRAQKYIQKYGPLAIQEEKRSGIPACITLGQGILETEAGASELMTQANNHFGIKCHNDWQGDKFLHTDDAPNECFKRYKCAEDSYKDHSDYLKRNQRYAQLFTLKTTDYKGWAVCLRKCGYATNPQYAQNLIKIIENFDLQHYTYSPLDSSLISDHSVAPIASAAPDFGALKNTADSARNFMAKKEATSTEDPEPAPDADAGKIVKVNDMKAFYARKGEMLLPYAVKYKVRYAHLLEMNDLPDGPLPFNTCIYLEKKQTLGTKPTHIVKAGESLLQISQIEGVQLKKLMAMNMLNPNEEPVIGSIIYLQSASAIKPDVRIGPMVAHTSDAIVNDADPAPKQDKDLITINRSKPAPAIVKPPVPAPVVVAKPAVPAPAVVAPPVVVAAPVIDTASETDEQEEPIPTPIHAPAVPVAVVAPPPPVPVVVAPVVVAKPSAPVSPLAANVDTVPQSALKAMNAPKTARIDSPKHRVAPQPPAHVIVVKTPDEEPRPASKPTVVVQAYVPAKPVVPVQQLDPATEEEFTKLKGDLDKVVYADDSKLMAKIESTKPEQKTDEPQVPKNAKYYTVKKGDTAFMIAKRNNLSVSDLLKMNDITASGVKVGKNLRVK